MARKKVEPLNSSSEEEFTKSLITSINQTMKEERAFNLKEDDSPTLIKQYISTGSTLLDYIISNKRDGGIPAGRLIDISGLNSTGKSLLALQILKSTQELGGVAIYLDTENATDVTLLESMGINLDTLVYLQPRYVEEVFDIIEHIIKKIKATDIDKPITVIWDSVAATPPKDELDGTYEQMTMGLGARAVSKGLRKITQFIGNNNVTLVFVNQLKMKIGAGMFEDPWTTPYGQAIPYHASVRLQLTRKRSSDIRDNEDAKEYLGVGVKAKVAKNKIAPPFRTCEFSIKFYKGIDEDMQLYDAIAGNSPVEINVDSRKLLVDAKKGAWHKFKVIDAKTNDVIYDSKFRKKDIGKRVLHNPELATYIDATLDDVLKRDYSDQEFPDDMKAIDAALEELED